MSSMTRHLSQGASIASITCGLLIVHSEQAANRPTRVDGDSLVVPADSLPKPNGNFPKGQNGVVVFRSVVVVNIDVSRPVDSDTSTYV